MNIIIFITYVQFQIPAAMDLMYVVRMGASDNDSKGGVSENDGVLPSPIETDLAVTVPYLILIGIALLSGSIGNCLVIASVVIDKVRLLY